MIEIKNVTKLYGSNLAVDNLSFSIKKGEIVGFLGPNGAGKSTTMKMITGFIPATSGSIEVAGFDVFKSPLEVKRRIGYMPEIVPLYTDMDVSQYLRFMAAIKGVPRSAVEKRLTFTLGRCGLMDVKDKFIGTLSKGYRQRVGLAQALIHDPDILILDEPSVGLDPHQIIEIRNLIKDIGREKTVILSSHILPEVSMTCERIIIIRNGTMVASDTTEGLTARLQGAQQLFLAVAGPEDAVVTELQRIAGVAGVTAAPAKDGLAQITVECATGADVRTAVAAQVINKGWGLAELRSINMSLEDIFLELTTNEEVA